MNYAILIIVLAIAIGVLAMGIRMILRRRRPSSLPIYIEGFGKIGYNREVMDRTSAEEIALELFKIKCRLWPELLGVYQTGMEYGITTILIDPLWYDPKHTAGIKLDCDIGQITMNPTVEWRCGDYRNAFGAEIANMIRFQLYGRDYIYASIDDDDVMRRRAATVLWKAL